jgi:hypothetical protein
LAVIGTACFVVSWLLDIVGSISSSEEIRGYAYGAALLTTVVVIPSIALAAILARILRCERCGLRVLTVRTPFLVPLTGCECIKCRQLSKRSSDPNA